MSNTARPSTPHPVRNLSSIFLTRRDLLQPLRDVVLAECDLPLEMANLLVELHGVRHLGWTEPESTGDGFVRFQTLLECLVHETGMFSRRIAALEQAGLLETRKACQVPELAMAGLHRNTQAARITAAGRRKIGPVWRKYEQLAEELAARIPAAELAVHYKVNQLLREEVKRRQAAAAQANQKPRG